MPADHPGATGRSARMPCSVPALALIALAALSARAQDAAFHCLPANPSRHPVFATPTTRVDVEGTGRYAGQAAFGDLNGDGLLDVAVACALVEPPLSNVNVCFNLGNAVFGPPSIYQAGEGTCAVEVADFDRDGRPDVAAANAADISILTNLGDGRLGAPAPYTAGTQPRSLKAGDFDRDGWIDLAVLNCLSQDVSIFRNRGDGAFFPEVRVAVGGVTPLALGLRNFPGPSLAIADFNRDGAPDIAVPAVTRLRILLNDGAGGFVLSPIGAPVVDSWAYGVVAGDLNRDGDTDLAVAVTGYGGRPSNCSVLIGNGDGTFQPPVAYNVSPNSKLATFNFTIHVDAGDLEGDGDLDLVFGHDFSYDRVTLLRNRGDGTFFPRELISNDYRNWFVALRDLRNTGRPDLTTLTNPSRLGLRVHLNDGAGRLLSYELSPPLEPGHSGESYQDGAFGDIDGDGEPDVAASVTDREFQLRVFRGLGGGRFERVLAVSVGSHQEASGHGVAMSDFNGDGRMDLAVADPIQPGGWIYPGKVWVLINTGGFSFRPPVAYGLDGVTPTSVVAADLNHDGHRDLVAWTIGVYPGNGVTPVDRRIAVFINRRDGTFNAPTYYPIWSAPWRPYGSAEVADLDRDGHPDLIGVAGGRFETGGVVTLRGRGDGTFASWSTIPVTSLPVSVWPADYNGDASPDLAVMHLSGIGGPPSLVQNYLTVLYNNGSGKFPTRTEYADRRLITGGWMAAADFDRDGHLDLAFPDASTLSSLVVFNRGDGTFDRPVTYAVAGYRDMGWPLGNFAPDLNRDGRPDLLTLNAMNYFSFLPNLSCPACYANCDGSTTPPVLNAADFACFLNRFAARHPQANCDSSLTAHGAPALDIADFVCFMNKFAAGCP